MFVRMRATHMLVGRESKLLKTRKGARAGWYRGDNSTCRMHIARAHYERYSARCKEAGIEENHRCVPDNVKEARRKANATAEGKKPMGQQTLEAVGVKKVQAPREFSAESILKTVTEHVVCGFQAHPFRIHSCLIRCD